MKLDDLFDTIATEAKVGKGEVKRVATATFAAIKTALETNDQVAVRGFGAFSMRDQPARQRTKDGETREVPASRRLTVRESRKKANKAKPDQA